MDVQAKRDELMAEARHLYAVEKKSMPLDYWMERLAAFAVAREQELELQLRALRKVPLVFDEVFEQADAVNDALVELRRAMKRAAVAKMCNSCNVTKVAEEFGINRSAPDGRSNKCKACATAYRKDYNATIKKQGHTGLPSGWRS